MFKVIPNGTNRLDIELSGKLDADDMKLALDELESKSKNIENGNMPSHLTKVDPRIRLQDYGDTLCR